MASTNKTSHYNLSQYTGNDKPTYLVDYNTDMSNIDTGIYNAQSKANTNESSIGTLSGLETTAKTDLVSAINELKGKTDGIGNLSNLTTEATSNLVSAINEVDAHADTNNQNIGTLTNLETTVKSSLVGAINEVNTKTNTNASNIDDLLSQFNLKNISTYTKANAINMQNISTSAGNFDITIAQDDDGNIFKIYGHGGLNRANDSGDNWKFTIPNALRKAPDTAYNINPAGINFNRTSLTYQGAVTITVNTDKSITFESGMPTTNNCTFDLYPCVYFNADFGDDPYTPTPNN